METVERLTGIELIDNPYPYLTKGCLYAISGGTCVGKTRMLLQMATNAAYSQRGLEVAIISGESGQGQLERYVYSQLSNRRIEIQGLDGLHIISATKLEQELGRCRFDVIAIDGISHFLGVGYDKRWPPQMVRRSVEFLKSLAETYDVSVLFTVWSAKDYQNPFTDLLVESASWVIEIQGEQNSDGLRQLYLSPGRYDVDECLGSVCFDGKAGLFRKRENAK